MGDLRIRIKHAVVTAKHAFGARFSKKIVLIFSFVGGLSEGFMLEM